MRILKLFFIFFIFQLSFFISAKVYAADFQTAYQVDYHITEVNNNLDTQANFSIAITNERSDIYVDKFSISFPVSFAITNLKTFDDQGEITPVVTNLKDSTKIELTFKNPNIGKDSVNNFYLSFNQSNLFKSNGNVWEVILPVIENRGDSTYKVNVYLPPGTDKKISIAKPKPDSIEGNQIVWNNPSTKTIYAVFGTSQLYDANLTYHLKNNSVAPVYIPVAFPPDTEYQKIYEKSLSVKPSKVYLDEDGNLMADYFLKPLETKTITTDFVIEVFPSQRDEVLPSVRDQFSKEKSYLLLQQKYWQIKSLDKIANLKTVSDIYSYIVNSLSYDYNRLTTGTIRLGAETILNKPSLAVCTEFTDLFVAASREKGIYSREVEGYGNSTDQNLRPLSLSSDVLHAWPEYYDEAQGIWRQVDPTWQNTSGIDYFDSLDLNHIAFVIHGKSSDYPSPAGMYKIDNTKDVQITAIVDRPQEIKQFKVDSVNISDNITDNQKYQGSFVIENTGNVYIWNSSVTLTAANLTVNPTSFTVLALAPGEKKEIDFQYASDKKNVGSKAKISLQINDKDYFDKKITIVSYLFDLGIKIGGGLILVILVFIVLRKKHKLTS